MGSFLPFSQFLWGLGFNAPEFSFSAGAVRHRTFPLIPVSVVVSTHGEIALYSLVSAGHCLYLEDNESGGYGGTDGLLGATPMQGLSVATGSVSARLCDAAAPAPGLQWSALTY